LVTYDVARGLVPRLDLVTHAGDKPPRYEYPAHYRLESSGSTRERSGQVRIVVCGAGVIGASTAYFLSRRGAEVIIVERMGVACASSGKAGAFLALDWNQGSPVDRLARRSFVLHEQLTHEIEGDWHYQGVDTFGAMAVA